MTRLPCLSFLFIAAWWTAAFLPRLHDSNASPPTFSTASRAPTSFLPYRRSQLHQALNGDTQMMIQLMALWDAEAKLLQETSHSTEEAFKRFNLLEESRPVLRLLPQTVVAGTFILALCDPCEVIAIPQLMREMTTLYPIEWTKQIPLSTDRYHVDSIYQAAPQLAFVASYSNPSTIETLRAQGITLIYLDALSSKEEIQSSILEVGKAIGREHRSALLNLFIDATLLHCKRRLNSAHGPEFLEKALFLNFRGACFAPAEDNLTASLLKNLNIWTLNAKALEHASHPIWEIPIELGRLAALQPEILLISTTDPDGARRFFMNHPALQAIPAIRNNRLYLIDSKVIDSPTQYIALAYYDLTQALLEVQ